MCDFHPLINTFTLGKKLFEFVADFLKITFPFDLQTSKDLQN